MNITVMDGENGKKVIEVDLHGALMSQFMADKLWATINTAGASCVDITLRNVGVVGGSLPRFIIDYGELHETLCEVAKEYRDYRRETEAAHPMYALREQDIVDGQTVCLVPAVPDPADVRSIFPRSGECHERAKRDAELTRAEWEADTLYWTRDNHPEPIHHTDGTETCYCGRGR